MLCATATRETTTEGGFEEEGEGKEQKKHVTKHVSTHMARQTRDIVAHH